mgnify:CR=1 FL=1
MAKKYTVMIFDPEKYGKSKTIFISKRPFWAVILFNVYMTDTLLYCKLSIDIPFSHHKSF